MTSAQVATALESERLPSGTESRLQVAIADRLTAIGASFEREHRLSEKDRVDFFLDGGIALEVKTQGSLNDVTRQLARYAEHESVTEILLVTSRLQLAAVPAELGGKPVRVARLWSFL